MEKQVENNDITVWDLSLLQTAQNPQQVLTEAWHNLATTSPYATFFQTHLAYQMYQSQPYLDAFALGVTENYQLMGVVVGYVQAEKGVKAYFSRRAIVNGGPLLHPSISVQALNKLLQALKQRTRQAIYVEIRNLHHYIDHKALFAANGFEYRPHLNVKITCDTWNNALQRMDNNRRRILNKPLPKSVTWCYATSNQQVNEFYTLLKAHYQTKVRKPLFPLSFFVDAVQQQTAKLLLLYHKETIIGGMLQVFLPDAAVYDYYACALDDAYKTLSPSVWLYGITMQQAIEQHIPVFDTMGAGKPQVPYGVRDFKLRFGGELVQEGRFLCINKPFLYRLGVAVLNFYTYICKN